MNLMKSVKTTAGVPVMVTYPSTAVVTYPNTIVVIYPEYGWGDLPEYCCGGDLPEYCCDGDLHEYRCIDDLPKYRSDDLPEYCEAVGSPTTRHSMASMAASSQKEYTILSPSRVSTSPVLARVGVDADIHGVHPG